MYVWAGACDLARGAVLMRAGADNQIGDVGAAALAEGVKASGTLTTLDLGCECSITLCRTYFEMFLCSAQTTPLAPRASGRSWIC